MKRGCIVFVLAMLCLGVMASVDTLVVIQIPPINVGDSGRNCVWDYGEVVDSIFHDVYILRDSTNPATMDVCKIGNKYQYKTERDTLFRIGFENATTQMQYRHPIAYLKNPIMLGDSIVGSFSGRGEYCHLLPILTEGTYVSKVDGVGSLILPNRQYHDVFRVVTCCEITKHIYDTTHFRLREYRWYKQNYEYPLLEATEIITELQDDTIYNRFAFYTDYEAIEDYELQDSIFIEEELQSNDSLCFTDGQFLPNPVVNDLFVSYRLTCSAIVWFSLHSSLGIVMYQSSPVVQEEGDWQITIPMSGYPQDDYVLYIHVDNIVLAETIIKM